MKNNYDVIVVGVGGMGSAAVYHLAKRGFKVLGLEKHNIPHSMGSSHGNSRIIRLAYYEDPSYVPLVRRAYELWKDLEAQVEEPLLHVTGSIDAGPIGSEVFEGSRKSCEIFDLPHEILTSAELRSRFPAYQLPEKHRAVFQPQGGFLKPERCIVSHVVLAQSLGAEIHGQESVIDWEPLPSGVRVRTTRGQYFAESLVFSVGAWVGEQVRPLASVAIPERLLVGWFQPFELNYFLPQNFPVFNMDVEEGRFYGFPVHELPGFKVGRWHHRRETIQPDQLGTEVSLEDEEVLRPFLNKYFPKGAGPTLALSPCLITNTPDENFILDFHPEHKQVCIISPCSGHGFKFCSAVGEIAADLIQNGKTSHDLSLHRITAAGRSFR